MKKFMIYANDNIPSIVTRREVKIKMEKAGYQYTEELLESDLIFCIGGDGALLRLLRDYAFPEIPIVGINTGHLGFFQEFQMDRIDEFLELLEKEDYHIQEYMGLTADILSEDCVLHQYTAINEIVVRGGGERLVHLDIVVEGNRIARFSGDGVLVCTPAGSTAYNYSLGGAIVDPQVDMMQITPIAPVNNVAYRSFTSGIVVPTTATIQLIPVNKESEFVAVIEDGRNIAEGEGIRRVDIRVAKRKARIVRFSDYSFWKKVKDKIIG